MNAVDAVWRVGRLTIAPVTQVFSRLRVYGKEKDRKSTRLNSSHS